MRSVKAHPVLRFVLAACSLPAFGPSCGPPAERTNENDQTGEIVFITARNDDAIAPVLKATAGRFEKQHPRARVAVVVPAADEPDGQVALLDALAEKSPRAVCIVPADTQAVRSSLEVLRAKGVVVVTLETPIAAEIPFLHSGYDPRDLGKALAEQVSAALPEQATLGLIVASNDARADLIARGFRAEIALNARFTLLQDLSFSGDQAAAESVLSVAAKKYPGIDAWVSAGAWPLPWSEQAKLWPQGCRVFVPVLTPDFAAALRQGHCHGIVLPDYDRMVTSALDLVGETLAGRVPEVRWHEAPIRSVTAANLAEFERTWSQWTGTE